MRKQILQLVSFLTITMFLVTIANAQITSYSDGGAWHMDTTWIGGVVPGTSDNVIINGPVFVMGDDACLNITINSGDTLQNYNSSGNRFLHVNGDITNNGFIQNNNSGYLSLYIIGDITNNGKWENSSTYFNGTGQQLISQMAGKTFDSYFSNNNTADTIKAITDLSFTRTFNLNNNTLDLNHHDIRFTGANNYFGYGTIVSPNEFLGTISIYSTTYIEGDVIVTDTLQNYNTSGNHLLHINGDITNNGVIESNTVGNLYLYLSGNITIIGNITTYV